MAQRRASLFINAFLVFAPGFLPKCATTPPLLGFLAAPSPRLLVISFVADAKPVAALLGFGPTRRADSQYS